MVPLALIRRSGPDLTILDERRSSPPGCAHAIHSAQGVPRGRPHEITMEREDVMQEPAYRWQKRKDHTGLTPAQKRAAMVAPAGADTASGGIVRPRNNEDPTALMSSAANADP